MRGYEYPVTADGCRRADPTPQEEVLYLIRESITNTTQAITTSERREDFACLLAALLALKVAEERVRR